MTTSTYSVKARQAFAYIPPHQSLDKCSVEYLDAKLNELVARISETEGYAAQRYLLGEYERIEAVYQTKVKKQKLIKLLTFGLFPRH